ncbi:enoyl-CoA hydratase/isomerase family protein [Pseudophaeobacter arcticus]|uniref:enoyl-CoA hydratase/isomerase family protein n=1 Tax=Pseudophaeobacter arcticus TaxID=385492 RepID=UPI003A981545
MTESDTLSTRDLGDGIVELQLGRGPVNALSADFLMGFAALITRLGADDAVRCIILSSPFKVFSAGLDLKEAQHFDLEQQQAIVRGLNEGFLALYACPKPVVASIGGAAIAGGLFFVLASDRRVAMTKSSFGLAEVRVGADFPVGPLEIAKATLDADTLRRLMLTGQPVGPVAARNFGFIDIIADDQEDLAAYSLSEARKLAALPSIAYGSIKQQLRGETIIKIKTALAAGGNAPEGGWFNSQTKPAMQRMIDQG